MSLARKFPNAFSATGSSLPAGERLSDSGGQVLFATFELTAPVSLPGTESIGDYLQREAQDVESLELLAAARRQLHQQIGDSADLRALRLRAGLSQAALASRIKSTQTQISHIEAGRTDPATDMVGRIANGLGVSADQVFAAIRAQRNSPSD
jgi:DNA-binding XRE family transcriptional regulator